MRRNTLALTVAAAIGLALLLPVPLSVALGQARPSSGGVAPGSDLSLGDIWADVASVNVLDAGTAIINAGTYNGSGVISAAGATHQFANLQLDAGSKLCLGGAGDCSVNIARTVANTLDVTASTAMIVSGSVQSTLGYHTAGADTSAYLQGKKVDGAGAIGLKLGNATALTNATAKTAVMYSDDATTPIWTFYANGGLTNETARGSLIYAGTADAGFSSLAVGANNSSTWWVDPNGFQYGRDAGFNDVTFTQHVRAATARGQNMFFETGDAGFSGLYALQGNFGGAAGAGGTVVGTATGFPGLWLGVAPASVSTSNYSLLTTGTDSIFNDQGGGTFFRSGNTNNFSVSAAGVVTNLRARSANFDWAPGDGGFSALSVGGPATLNGFSVSTGGLVTRYGNVATGGAGVPAIQAFGTVSSTSTDDVTIATITAPAADTYYEVGAYLDCTAWTSSSVSILFDWTDCGGDAHSEAAMVGYGLVGNSQVTSVSGAGPMVYYPFPVCLNASSTLTAKTNFGGTATADFAAWVKKIGP